MVKSLTLGEFLLITGSSHADLKLYEVTAKFYTLSLAYLVLFNKKNIPTVALIAYQQGNNLIHPNHYHYTFLWIKENLQTRGSRIDFQIFVSYLCKNYDRIEFRLADLLDYRAFINNKFDLRLRYTFVKRVSDTLYSHGVLKHYKRALEIYNLSFKEVKLAEILEQNLNFLYASSIVKATKKELIRRVLNSLDDESLLLCFAVNEQNIGVVGSGIVLLGHKKAYFLFCCSEKGEQTSAINSFMYIKVQNLLIQKGVKEFDYMGANITNIAEFKHTLNPELTQYYIVTYNSKLSLKKLISIFDEMIKKIVNYVR